MKKNLLNRKIVNIRDKNKHCLTNTDRTDSKSPVEGSAGNSVSFTE